MEYIEITMTPVEKQDFYARKLRLIEDNAPITDEDKVDVLNTVSQLVNESEENVSYANKMLYLRDFVTRIDDHNFFAEFKSEL